MSRQDEIIAAALLLVGCAVACGETQRSSGEPADASPGGTGGATGTGGAGAGVVCTDDGGFAFAAVARQCTVDSDCTIQIAPTCCGADGALGIATAQANAYSGCFALAPGACSGLGCAKYLGYQTDTGRTTPWQGTTPPPIDLVSVGCVGHLCTTDVGAVQDAAPDAYAGDAATDAGA